MKLFAFLLGTFPQVALAAPPAPGIDPCSTIGGCSLSGGGIIALVIQNTAALFVSIAAGASVLFVVVGGFQMLLSFGNDSTVTKGKNSVMFALGGFALVLAAQAIVSFVVNNAIGGGLVLATVNPAVSLMGVAVRMMLSVFNVAFALVAIGSAIRMVVAHGKSDEFGKARSALIFSIVGAVIVNVARALVNIILTAGF